MFQDEARFGRINDVRRCWAPRPMRPLCQAMLTHEYTYAYASCEPATGTMDALILPQVNTQCMQIFLPIQIWSAANRQQKGLGKYFPLA